MPPVLRGTALLLSSAYEENELWKISVSRSVLVRCLAKLPVPFPKSYRAAFIIQAFDWLRLGVTSRPLCVIMVSCPWKAARADRCF